MRKDTALSFRIPSMLKAEVEALAMKEGRSIAQVCEAFIRAGLENYKKEGAKYFQRFLSRRKETST
jgi:predicted DNA-binding protein